MPRKKSGKEVAVKDLRWTLDPKKLSFKTTDELKPLSEIIGQKRGVEAFRFGAGIKKSGYNIFVTGPAGSGRLATVKKLLHEISADNGSVPDDLCYVNNFKKPEAPLLLKFKAGQGKKFKKDIHDLVDTLKKEVPRLFEGQDYINRKKEIMDEYEKKGKGFFKELDKKVRDEGFTLVDVQVGQIKRPEVVPLIDGQPTHIDQVEQMVEKGRFPKKEFEELYKKYLVLRNEIDQIFLELRDLQKEIQRNTEEMDRVLFTSMANEIIAPLKSRYKNKKVEAFLKDMVEDMSENLQIFTSQQQEVFPGMPVMGGRSNQFESYNVNLIVDNSDQKGPPVIVEINPTYQNVFGSIERVVDRSGVWRTDFSKIRAGSMVKANGGYLVLNLLEAAREPGVWPTLKRSLKNQAMQIETYDPFYLFTTTGLKPEPVDMDVKVVLISDSYLYHLLMGFDEDIPKIFKVRAEFDTAMNRDDEAIAKFAEFIRMKTEEEKLKPFDKKAVAALVEYAVRMAGRQEKISTGFSVITDIIREADYWALQGKKAVVTDLHVDKAIDSRIYRTNMIEEKLQEQIDRGTLMIDVEGSKVGQVNGLAVYSLGDYMFGKPSRITASTSMGRAGIINIERESDMSGSTHNKGVLILGGYLREKYAQDKPLTISASIAFEQSYGGVDGDSASSTEIYALLSSLSGIPIMQNIAVTGSVNQKGEVQAIGGVNQKIEGFFDCCKKKGLTGHQGVMIPDSNVKDLMLRKDVVEEIKKGKFTVYAVKTIDEGIEILTGKKAGVKKEDGTYPKDTVNYLVDKKLKDLAEGLGKFGKNNNNGNGLTKKKSVERQVTS
ncbi:MAG: AAA family ATPase [Deltaproteobacteria bacterium]|nr:AAA family ATPase [Deltaproteobacteria bacterium]